MYGNKSIKHKADGTKYKDFYYYGCKHRSMIRGHKCDYKKQIREELLDDAVAEVIVKLVSNPKFAAMMQEKINMKVDTAAIDQEIANYEKQLRQHYSVKAKLAEEIDSLDPDDRHYVRRKADLDDRLYRMYDKIEETESLLIAARAKKQSIEAEKLTGDNIYKVLIYFEKLYGVMNEAERRQLIEALISEIQIYPERQANGQWLKSIKFKLPIIEEDMSISLDNEEQVDTCVTIYENGVPAGWDVLLRMERLDCVAELLREEEGLTVDEVRVLARDIAAALQAAHGAGLIHRDVKPANLYRTADGHFQLGDFGVARRCRTGVLQTMVGTAVYMAPEVARGEVYDGRADLYSLGIVLYQLLNHGQLPLMGEDTPFDAREDAVHRRWQGAKLPLPPDGDRRLKKIVLRCCEPQPQKRYASADALLQALEQRPRGCKVAAAGWGCAALATALLVIPRPDDSSTVT